jgi:multiple sugar transport system substrate-binding protein
MTSRLSRRRFLQGSAVGALGLGVGGVGAFLQACSPAASSPGASAPAPGASGSAVASSAVASTPVALTLWATSYWKGRTGTEANGKSSDYYDWEISRFRETHPNVTIEYTETPSTPEGGAKYDTAVAAGHPPDVMYANADSQWKWVPQGGLEPIESYIASDFLSDWVPAASQMSKYPDGHQYLWPTEIAVGGGVFVNLDLAKKFGADTLVPPDPDRAWTPDQFLDFVTKCTHPPVFGTALMTDWVYQVNQFLYGFGASFWNELGTKVIVNSDEGVTGLQYLVDLQNVHKVVPPGTPGRTNDQVLRMFRQQEIAVYPSQPYYVTAFRSQPEFKTNFKWSFVQPPALTGKMRAEANLGGFFVAKQTDPAKRDAAMAFAAQMCSPESLTIRTNIQGVIASRLSLQSLVASDPDRHVEALIAATAAPFGRLYTEVQTKFWTPNLDAAFAGTKSIRQALDDTAAGGNKLLAEAAAEFNWPTAP